MRLNQIGQQVPSHSNKSTRAEHGCPREVHQTSGRCYREKATKMATRLSIGAGLVNGISLGSLPPP